MATFRHIKEVIEFELVEKLNVPVHWNDLQNNPALRDCEVFINNQGSLFKLTEEEYDIIRETIDNKNIIIDILDEGSKSIPYSYDNDPEKPFIPAQEFGQVRLHQNNRFYNFLIRVCRIIYDNTLPTEKPGEWMFKDFTRDEKKMNRLFEAFIRNFYKKEFPRWKVGTEVLRWQFQMPEEAHRDFLPVMRTDISIENEKGKIIIDAKYYRETFATHYDREKIHSQNLYQLFSYLLNQQCSDYPDSFKTRGILIYPDTGKEIDLDYWYDQHLIQIKTLNLNVNWREIESRLRGVV